MRSSASPPLASVGALPIIDSGQTTRIRTAATATVIHMIAREEWGLLLSMASLVSQR